MDSTAEHGPVPTVHHGSVSLESQTSWQISAYPHAFGVSMAHWHSKPALPRASTHQAHCEHLALLYGADPGRQPSWLPSCLLLPLPPLWLSSCFPEAACILKAGCLPFDSAQAPSSSQQQQAGQRLPRAAAVSHFWWRLMQSAVLQRDTELWNCLFMPHFPFRRLDYSEDIIYLTLWSWRGDVGRLLLPWPTSLKQQRTQSSSGLRKMAAAPTRTHLCGLTLPCVVGERVHIPGDKPTVAFPLAFPLCTISSSPLPTKASPTQTQPLAPCCRAAGCRLGLRCCNKDTGRRWGGFLGCFYADWWTKRSLLTTCPPQELVWAIWSPH